MYKCDNCGFRARQYYWHCPACAAWETYSPRRTEEAKVPVVSTTDPRVIIALDFPAAREAAAFAARLDPQACRVKIGMELYAAAGPSFVRELVQSGFGVFLDLKFHDIPNTVGAACAAAARHWRVDDQRARSGRAGDAGGRTGSDGRCATGPL
jgi:hypothetical protein